MKAKLNRVIHGTAFDKRLTLFSRISRCFIHSRRFRVSPSVWTSLSGAKKKFFSCHKDTMRSTFTQSRGFDLFFGVLCLLHKQLQGDARVKIALNCWTNTSGATTANGIEHWVDRRFYHRRSVISSSLTWQTNFLFDSSTRKISRSFWTFSLSRRSLLPNKSFFAEFDSITQLISRQSVHAKAKQLKRFSQHSDHLGR